MKYIGSPLSPIFESFGLMALLLYLLTRYLPETSLKDPLRRQATTILAPERLIRQAALKEGR